MVISIGHARTIFSSGEMESETTVSKTRLRPESESSNY
jgi:hypothetical protein